MMVSKLISTAAIIVSITASTAFTAVDASAMNDQMQKGIVTESDQKVKQDHRNKHDEFEKDPIKALEARKAKVQSLLKEGKITKEKADERTAAIDAKIKEIQSFDKLTLQQKKDLLINNCKARLEKQVKEGRLDKAEVDSILKEYTEKINKWDGKGYPIFHSKGFHDKGEKPEK